jgi:hypothetical protein
MRRVRRERQAELVDKIIAIVSITVEEEKY